MSEGKYKKLRNSHPCKKGNILNHFHNIKILQENKLQSNFHYQITPAVHILAKIYMHTNCNPAIVINQLLLVETCVPWNWSKK